MQSYDIYSKKTICRVSYTLLYVSYPCQMLLFIRLSWELFVLLDAFIIDDAAPIEAEGEITDMAVGNLYGKEGANVCAMNDAITWLFGNNETEIFVSLHHK